MNQKLKGKLVVVTGAGSGIGAVSACALAAEGAAVVLCGPDNGSLEKFHSRTATVLQPG